MTVASTVGVAMTSTTAATTLVGMTVAATVGVAMTSTATAAGCCRYFALSTCTGLTHGHSLRRSTCLGGTVCSWRNRDVGDAQQNSATLSTPVCSTSIPLIVRLVIR